MEKRWYLTPEDFKVAAKNGIKRSTVHSRVHSLGWDTEKAITQPLARSFTPEQKQLIEDCPVSRSTVYKRIDKGMTFEEAVTLPLVNHKRSRVFTDEERILLFNMEITLSAAINRKNRGWSKERIFSTPPRKTGE